MSPVVEYRISKHAVTDKFYAIVIGANGDHLAGIPADSLSELLAKLEDFPLFHSVGWLKGH